MSESFEFVVPSQETLDEFGISFDALEVCYNECVGFQDFLSQWAGELRPGQRYRMRIDPVIEEGD